MKKKIFILLIIILLITSEFLFFYKNNYKKIKTGNNIIKSAENIKEYILNISSYEAEIEVQIQSNKNVTKYVMKQEYKDGNFRQEVLEPENIKGLITTYDGKNLKIENTNLSLTKLYNDYPNINNNMLCLNTFIEEYKNCQDKECEEKDDKIILSNKIENTNRYATYKKLYIDKKTFEPIELEIQDINKNVIINILYKEIKIDSKTDKQILADK